MNVLWSWIHRFWKQRNLTVLLYWFTSFDFPREQSPSWSLEVRGSFLLGQIGKFLPGHKKVKSRYTAERQCGTGTVPPDNPHHFYLLNWKQMSTSIQNEELSEQQHKGRLFFCVSRNWSCSCTYSDWSPSFPSSTLWRDLLPLERVKVEKSNCWRLNPDGMLR